MWGSSGPAGAFVGEGGWRLKLWLWLWLVRGAGTAHDGIGGWVDGSERRPDDRSFGSGRRNGRVVEACVGQVPRPALGVEGRVRGRRVRAVCDSMFQTRSLPLGSGRFVGVRESHLAPYLTKAGDGDVDRASFEYVLRTDFPCF